MIKFLVALSVSIKIPENQHAIKYVSGYYSLTDKRKITPDTLFQIGSITKTVTATIILKLAEENKLNLDDKLLKWLPQFSRWKNITVNDLLRHTSGIEDYTHGNQFDQMLRQNPEQFFSLSTLANLAYHKKDFATPGEKYHYTNTDYILLGMIIKKVTHQSLQQVFDDYIARYHLNNTFYTPIGYPISIIQKIAHGYNRDGTFRFNKDVTQVSLSFAQSAGALISTPNDLVDWLQQLFSGKILSDHSLKTMLKITPVEDGEGAGIGLFNFKNMGPTWVHAGGTPGYESFYAYNPQHKIYLALMYNVKPKQQLIFIKIADDIFNAVSIR